MFVLGIETSGLDGSIALLRNQECLGERVLNQTGRRHAQALVLEIGELLRTQRLTARDLGSVAVSRGPGSFTGLRVGMVCAKTLAYATGCQFISVDTFHAIAENVPRQIQRVTVVEDAQRDDLFAGDYERIENGDWKMVSPIRITTVENFLRDRPQDSVVVGPGLRKLDTNQISAHWLKTPDMSQPRAVAIATLGHQLLTTTSETTRTDEYNFWKASPFYLRMSAAEEKRANDDAAKAASVQTN